MSKDYVFAAGKSKADNSIVAAFDLPGGGASPRVSVLLRGVKAGAEAVVFTGTSVASMGGAAPEVSEIRFSIPANWQDIQKMIEARCLVIAASAADRRIVAKSNGGPATPISGQNALEDMLKRFGKETGEQEMTPTFIRTPIDLKAALGVTNADVRSLLRSKTAEGETAYFPVKMFGISAEIIADGFKALEAVPAVEKMMGQIKRPAIEIPEIDVAAAKECLKGVENPAISAVAYYGDMSCPEQERGDRQQIAKTYPVLARVIQNDAEAREAIKNRTSVQEVLMRNLGLTKAGLKAFQKITTPLPSDDATEAGVELTATNALGVTRRVETRYSGSSNIGKALSVMSELPPEWAPKNDEAWIAFSDSLFSMALPVSNLTGISVTDLLKPSKGDWVEFRKTLARAADLPIEDFDRRRMALKAGEISDMLKLFGRSIVIGNAVRAAVSRGCRLDPIKPEGENEIIAKAMQASWKIFAGKSKNILASFLEAERVYEGREVDILGAMVQSSEEGHDDLANKTEFERLFASGGMIKIREKFVASNGYVVDPILTVEGMKKVGMFMDHCVKEHWHISEAQKGTEHFFQVSHPDAPNNPYYQGTLMLPEITAGRPVMYSQYFTFDNGQVIAKKTANGRSHKMAPPPELKFIDKANGVADGALVSEQCWQAWEEWRDSFTSEMVEKAAKHRQEWQDFYYEQRGIQINKSAAENAKAWEPITGRGMSDPDMFQKTWDAWQEVIKKADKGFVAPSSEVLFKNQECREIATSISMAAGALMLREAEERRREAEARKAAEAEAPAP